MRTEKSAWSGETRSAIALNLPYDKQIQMAVWGKKTAQKVAKALKPLVGKKVVLYGGGGWDSNIGKLMRVRVGKTTYRKDLNKPIRMGYEVNVRMTFKQPDAPFGNKVFEPHIGSWKIARLVKK